MIKFECNYKCAHVSNVTHIGNSYTCIHGRLEYININFPIASCQAFSAVLIVHIKTHDSESRGQEEAGRTRRTSELFTGSTALK